MSMFIWGVLVNAIIGFIYVTIVVFLLWLAFGKKIKEISYQVMYNAMSDAIRDNEKDD